VSFLTYERVITAKRDTRSSIYLFPLSRSFGKYRVSDDHRNDAECGAARRGDADLSFFDLSSDRADDRLHTPNRISRVAVRLRDSDNFEIAFALIWQIISRGTRQRREMTGLVYSLEKCMNDDSGAPDCVLQVEAFVNEIV